MSEEHKSRLAQVMRYLVFAVFFLLALGLISVSYTASLAVVLGVVLAWVVREFGLSIIPNVSNLEPPKKILLLTLLLLVVIVVITLPFSKGFIYPVPPTEVAAVPMTPSASSAAPLTATPSTRVAAVPMTPSASSAAPLTATPTSISAAPLTATPTSIPAVAEYQVAIEPVDAQAFIVEEEALTDGDELIDSQNREVKSTSLGLILRELHITPWDVPPPATTGPSAFMKRVRIVKAPLCLRRCPTSMVILLDFPKGSFYQAKEAIDIEKEPYVDTEIISWSVRDLDRGITFAYIPAPYQHFRLFLIPFIEFASFSSWLIGFGGFIAASLIYPIIKPLLRRNAKGKHNKETTHGPTSASFDLLAQATCAVLIDGQIAGTAWLVSNDGHLITAGHVLGEDEPLSQVEVQFEGAAPSSASRIQWSFQQNMGIDFAILQLDSPVDKRQPLPISLVESVEGKCRLVGYGHTLSDRSQGMGEFIGSVDRGNSADNRLFRLRSPELAEEGYSGGAVFSEELGAVVAIQTEATRRNLGAGRDTVLAMPLYRVAHHWKPLSELTKFAKRPWVVVPYKSVS